MRRFQLFEFNDQPWLPTALRLGMTDYLLTIERLAGVGDALAPELDRLVEGSGAERIVDMCSGSGGPLVAIAPKLSRPVPVLLTDWFPAAAPRSLGDGIAFHPDPVDARDVHLPGLRTMFNALHHFSPADARAILRSAFEARQPIAIFEVTERRVPNLLSVFLIPLFVALVVPLIRPFRPLTWVLTYLLPVLPGLVAWDGFVSHLRTYTTAELEEMVADLRADGWRWEVRRVQFAPGAHATVLTGQGG